MQVPWRGPVTFVDISDYSKLKAEEGIGKVEAGVEKNTTKIKRTSNLIAAKRNREWQHKREGRRSSPATTQTNPVPLTPSV